MSETLPPSSRSSRPAIVPDLAMHAAGTLIDGFDRGMPPGHPPLRLDAVGRQGWSIPAEDLCLPVLAVSDSAVAHNLAVLDAYAAEHGLHICAHGKTMMAPQLLARVLAGARTVGLCAATVQQAAVMAACGAPHVFIANQVVGRANLLRLAELTRQHPRTRFLVLVDSRAGLDQLVAHACPALLPGTELDLLIEVGVPGGRAGIRDLRSAEALMAAVATHRGRGAPIRLRGVSSYEGAVPDGPDAAAGIARLFALTAEVYDALPAHGLAADPVPIISAGGSASFDLVTRAFGTRRYAVAPQIWLRPGVAPTYDHVVYGERLARMDARRGFVLGGVVASAVATFRPALALWAAVQSIPDRDVAIVAAGIRDFPADAGYPTLLAHYRDGRRLAEFPAGRHSLSKANDQHGYLPLDGLPDIRVGDVLRFGISHPCTAFDKWRILFTVDDDDRVTGAVRTYF